MNKNAIEEFINRFINEAVVMDQERVVSNSEIQVHNNISYSKIIVEGEPYRVNSNTFNTLIFEHRIFENCIISID